MRRRHFGPLLNVVLQNDSGFVDVNLELGRSALQRERPDHDGALPDSATITASIGNIHQEREEWPEALEAYDAALALVPSHRDALLGRTISVSHLLRHEDAIASANRLLELRSKAICAPPSRRRGQLAQADPAFRSGYRWLSDRDGRRVLCHEGILVGAWPVD
jgi:tetratricopeptide (TPR) repeat protein